MGWSFGIITAGETPPYLKDVIRSIYLYGGDDPEVIIVGGAPLPRRVISSSLDFIPTPHFVQFDETIKPGWITKKKNLIAQSAVHDNICIMHDYIALEPGWIEGFEAFGEDWITGNNTVLNQDGSRYRCWDVIGNDAWHDFGDQSKPFFDEPGRMLSYDIKITDKIARWLYYSGAYFVAKRQILLETSLDETRVAGQGEDVKWCRELYFKYGISAFKFNSSSKVRFLKYKDPVSWQLLPEIKNVD